MKNVGSFDVDGENRLEAGRIRGPLPSQMFRDTFSADCICHLRNYYSVRSSACLPSSPILDFSRASNIQS